MEEKLIQFVSQNRFLFDKSREQKLQERSSKLNIPAEKLKSRWRTLRDKFYKDIKKKPSGSGVDSPHKKWKRLDSLRFLKDVKMDNLNTHGNYGEVEEILDEDDSFLCGDFAESIFNSNNTESQLSSQTPKTTARRRNTEEDSSFPSGDFGESISISNNAALQNSSQTSTPPGRKRKIEDIIESANKDFKKVTSLAENMLVGGVNKSSIHLFFEGLAVQAEGANLTSMELSALQLQMCKSFHQFMENRNT
ncbi:uncharacterized protein LOC118749695 [Rhagoletis pomonella]|uniref:uncharacterized protein LOC118749695 n=1 Tax=Rhagoletis pomonella TaxID=28610 RepID=UPI00177B5EFE|nr:uncharacterized protein LOC118749695 [Rhagoletis pomonella]